MNKATKEQIIEALKVWMQENDFLPAQFAKHFSFPESYLSILLGGGFEVPNGTGKPTVIADKYFRKLAEYIGFETEKSAVKWSFKPTTQALEMLATLEDAKKFGYTNLIIGNTGSGKTYVSDLFCSKSPKSNIKITVGSMDNITDLLDKICDKLKIPAVTYKAQKMRNIIEKLYEMRNDGLQPILIFDEAEYMKQPTLCNIKELHDWLHTKIGIVLIGTDQLLTKIERLKKKNAPGMPQFYRRVKFGIRTLKAVDTRFQEFLNDVEDKELRKFIQRECENYGELHDVLLPAMREAERLSEPLTEDLVRKILNMPKR